MPQIVFFLLSMHFCAILFFLLHLKKAAGRTLSSTWLHNLNLRFSLRLFGQREKDLLFRLCVEISRVQPNNKRFAKTQCLLLADKVQKITFFIKFALKRLGTLFYFLKSEADSTNQFYSQV
jgi:hypothetical protein